MANYTWRFGEEGSGFYFTITYDSLQHEFTATSIEGSLDLNALWFASDDVEADVSLKGRDNSLNMNGKNIVWEDGEASKQKIEYDAVQKLSHPGLGKDGKNKDTFIEEGESFEFDADSDFDPEMFTTLGVKTTNNTGNNGSKLADTSAEVSFDAPDMYDQDVTPNAIFGSGNINGSYTTSTTEDGEHSVELGLRGKLRFDENNQPQNTFNSNGDGTYTFDNILPPSGFGFDPASPTTPIWSFEWSINTDVSGTSGKSLNDYTYLLEIDGDSSSDTDFGTLAFDPINVPLADHAIGNNSTPNGGGTVAVALVDYDGLIYMNNVAQNSWSYEFFNEPTDGLYLEQLASFDPTDEGIYTIQLSAFDDVDLVGQVSIDIIVEGSM